MTTIGTYEAKTKLPDLLHRVEAGETFVITRNGKPVARLSPIQAEPSPGDAAEVLEAFRQIRSRAKETGPSIRELIKKGRRY